MYIVFPTKFNRLQWFNGYLASLPHWRPRFDSRGRKYFFVFNLIIPIIYIFCNKNLVAFYIKFNALAKSSQQSFLFFFFFSIYTYKFSNPNRIITVMVTDMRLCNFFKFAFCQISYIACNERQAFFTSEDTKRYKLWSCQNVCEALIYLLDNIYIRFGTKLYRQIVGIPMGTNCAPLVADLFLFCYERYLMYI